MEVGAAIYLDFVERATGLRITPEQWNIIKLMAGAENHRLAHACAPYDRTGRAMFYLNYATRSTHKPALVENGRAVSPLLDAYVEAQSRLRRDWGKVTVETVLTVEFIAGQGIHKIIEAAVTETQVQSEVTQRTVNVDVAVRAAVEAERRRIAEVVRNLNPQSLSGHPAGTYANVIVTRTRNAIAAVIADDTAETFLLSNRDNLLR